MIKLYVANLGKYVEGSLVGGWIALPVDEEEFKTFLTDVVGINEEYEEYAIHDYESDINDLKIGEYDSIDELNEIAILYDCMQDYEKLVVESIMEWNYYGSGSSALKESIEQVENFYLLSDVNNDSDYGYYLVEEGSIGEIPSYLENYIDYEGLGRDNYINGECYYSVNGLINKC